MRVRQPSRPPGNSSTSHRDVQAGQSGELLAHDGSLQGPLRGTGRVLPVAAATSPRPRVRAGRRDPVRRRFEDLNGISAAERPAGVLGDLSPNPLSRQGVADKDDAAVRGIPDSGHAVPAVRSRSYPKLEESAQ